MGSLTSALERLLSSYSLKYLPSCQFFIQRVYVAFEANSDLCLSFLRRCVDYGEKAIGCHLPYIPIPLPAPFSVMASYDLRERTVGFQSEMPGISAENAPSMQGQSSYKLTSFNGHRPVTTDTSEQAHESLKSHTRRPCA
jgi:hypothetical protein